ncbi:MAG: ribosome assembly RNA-binding protein YhbY [Polyangiaceae bacterium]
MAEKKNETESPDGEAPRAALPKTLPGVALRHLRALGHDLKPVVMVGKDGITDSLVEATRAALRTHELIKLKIQSEAPVDRHEAAAALAAATDAVLAQVIGRTFLLYKRRQKNPKIVLPKARS